MVMAPLRNRKACRELEGIDSVYVGSLGVLLVEVSHHPASSTQKGRSEYGSGLLNYAATVCGGHEG
jgi:hypothetical protein